MQGHNLTEERPATYQEHTYSIDPKGNGFKRTHILLKINHNGINQSYCLNNTRNP